MNNNPARQIHFVHLAAWDKNQHLQKPSFIYLILGLGASPQMRLCDSVGPFPGIVPPRKFP